MSKQSAMNKMQGKGDKEVNYIGWLVFIS
jgi:hypothetical protein